jgi:hypothetical protein
MTLAYLTKVFMALAEAEPSYPIQREGRGPKGKRTTLLVAIHVLFSSRLVLTRRDFDIRNLP